MKVTATSGKSTYTLEDAEEHAHLRVTRLNPGQERDEHFYIPRELVEKYAIAVLSAGAPAILRRIFGDLVVMKEEDRG